MISQNFNDWLNYMHAIQGSGVMMHPVEGEEVPEGIPVTYKDANGNEKVLYLPEGTTTFPATFRNNREVTEIVIPEGITEIADYAFESCWGLKKLVIPEGVTETSTNMCLGCSAMELIDFPESLTKIGYQSFRDCTKLKSLYITENITEIKEGAFKNCSSLQQVMYYGNLTKIGNYAFQDCKKLGSISHPSNKEATIEYIGKYAFANCVEFSDCYTYITNNKTATINECAFSNTGVIYCNTYDNMVFGEGVFKNCKFMKNVIWRSREIPRAAFYGCEKLQQFGAGENVTTMSMQVFDDCPLLTSVTFESKVPVQPESEMWLDFPDTVTAIYVPADAVDAYKADENWAKYADRIQAISE